MRNLDDGLQFWLGILLLSLACYLVTLGAIAVTLQMWAEYGY